MLRACSVAARSLRPRAPHASAMPHLLRADCSCDLSEQITATVSDNGGRSIFKGIEPSDFIVASDQTRKDMVEKIMCVPLNSGVIVSYV